MNSESFYLRHKLVKKSHDWLIDGSVSTNDEQGTSKNCHDVVPSRLKKIRKSKPLGLEIGIIVEWQSLDTAEELSTILTSGNHEDMRASDLGDGTGVSHSPTSHGSQLSPSLPSLKLN